MLKWDKTIELEDGKTVRIDNAPNNARIMTVTERKPRGMPDAQPASIKLILSADARNLLKAEL